MRAILAAGGLALLLLLGVASPAVAQDYPTPTTSPATSVDRTVVEQDPPGELARTGSDNTELLLVVGAGVLVAGGAFLVVSKRQHAKHSA